MYRVFNGDGREADSDGYYLVWRKVAGPFTTKKAAEEVVDTLYTYDRKKEKEIIADINKKKWDYPEDLLKMRRQELERLSSMAYFVASDEDIEEAEWRDISVLGY